MRIVASRLLRTSGTLTTAVASARARWGVREGLLLRLEDEDGVVGLGEASPLPGYSPDCLEACARALEGIAARLGPLDDTAGAGESLFSALAPVASALEGTPAARFALETALLDVLGQRQGRSLGACLSGGEAMGPVTLNGMVDGAVTPERWATEVRRLLGRGVRTVKIKVGVPGVAFEHELAALRSLRREVPGTFALRLDANGAWSTEEARRNLDRLAEVSPEFVEEPTRGAGLLALGECAVPWAADESLATRELREALLAAPGCGAVVLKPALLGGLLAARALAERAARQGRGVVVTHLFDGPVALASACELALGLGVIPRACGLDRHAGLSAWPRVDLSQRSHGGELRAGGGFGLGLSRESREALGV